MDAVDEAFNESTRGRYTRSDAVAIYNSGTPPQEYTRSPRIPRRLGIANIDANTRLLLGASPPRYGELPAPTDLPAA
jgi:hypothetical protein